MAGNTKQIFQSLAVNVCIALAKGVAALFTGPAVFFPALMLGGATSTFSEVPWANFILIALVPCLLWSLCLPPMRHWSGRALVTAAAVAVLVPCAVAVILALHAETLDFSG